jgi:hypothetical protein
MFLVAGPGSARDRREGDPAVLHQQDGRSSARHRDVGAAYTDDDHRFIENGFKAILLRSFPLPADDPSGDERFRALLDALDRVHRRDG